MSKRKIKNPQTLKEHLGNLTVDELRERAQHIPDPLPTRKGEIVDCIHNAIMGDRGLNHLWIKLDETQRAAIAEVVHSPSTRFKAEAFRAKYGQDPNWGTGSRWGRGKPSVLALFFYKNEMPVDLKAALIQIAPKPQTATMKTVAELPDQVELDVRSWRDDEADVVDLWVRDTQQMAQQDLLAVLRLVEAGKVRVTAKTLRPTAATIRAIAEVLEGGDYYPPPSPEAEYCEGEPDYMRAFAWPLLLQAAKLAEISGSKLKLTTSGAKALNSPASKALQTVWKRWQKSRLLDEFNRIKLIKGQTGRGQHAMTAVGPRRQTIVNAMAELPVNQWVDFDEFSRYMQATGHTFEISRDLWTLYVEEHGYGSLGYDGYGDWHIVQGRYLLVFLMEYAATLGLIDIAYVQPANARIDFTDLWGVDDYAALSDYDGLRYLRLNNLGAWILGLTDKYQPPAFEEQKIFNVLPNHDIVVADSLRAGDRLLLERFAKQSSDLVWQLDQELLLKAQEEGLSIAEVQQFLTAKSTNALPQPVEIMFTEMAEKVQRLVSVEPAHLIEVQDQRTAHLLSIDNKLSKYCQLVGERQLVVPAKSLSAFRRTLRSLGYAMPQATD